MKTIWAGFLLMISTAAFAAIPEDHTAPPVLQFLPENCPIPPSSFWSFFNPFSSTRVSDPPVGSVCASPSGLIQYQVHASSGIQLRALVINRLAEPLEIRPALHPAGRGPLKDFYTQAQGEPSFIPEAVVNGGFFDPKTGVPIGFLISKNHLKFLNVAGSKYRSMVGIYSSTSTTGVQVKITDMQNKPRCWIRSGSENWMVSSVNVPSSKEGLSLFTPGYGSRTPYTARPTYEWVLTPDPQRDSSYQLARLLPNSWGGTTIPPDGLVLVAPTPTVAGASSHDAEEFAFKCDFPDEWERDRVLNGFMAGPRLLKNGEVDLEAPVNEQLAQIKSPERMVLGLTQDGLLVIVWMKRLVPSPALTDVQELTASARMNLSFEQAARLLKDMGVVEAIGLDGGGSSSIYMRLASNRSSEAIDHTRRRIPYGLVIGVRQPTLIGKTDGRSDRP